MDMVEMDMVEMDMVDMDMMDTHPSPHIHKFWTFTMNLPEKGISMLKKKKTLISLLGSPANTIPCVFD